MIDQLKQVVCSSHFFLDQILKEGDYVIDATCGNGHDSLYLSEKVGNDGHVFALDIQETAIKKAQELFKEINCSNIELFLADHQDLLTLINPSYQGKIKAIVYNLGFLPGGDKTITTKAETLLKSIRAALKLLAKGGIITICLYPHEEGKREKQELIQFVSELSNEYNAYLFSRINRHDPPELLIITRDK